ncbi:MULTISPECIES: hypothetical protein [unclassified Streptomyces]|uniref:hypothetical protein n=1 Tax=unclassified Streptomyces TaxID=2593676 RepID=UPI000747DDE5|nr:MULTISPECIES: hypothetical protein [unclassified Streptomyces]KUL76451.1 hypothetical protein ADL34_11715 [Streptomyces sp. NRRL WC-3605]KUL78504.1 hypothetical protein ADL33_06680 [Streptomyces sp. NRRL WC-3604]
MRAPTTRHIASSALCTALLLGAVAPALAAGPDDTRPASRTAAADQRAVLRGQTGALAGLGTVLTPVTRLLDAALAADDDPLTAAEAKKLAEAAREAVAQAREEALAEAEKELAAASEQAEQAREQAEQARKEAAEAREEALTEAGVDTGTTASNLTPGALDGLGKAVEDLLAALLSGGTGQVDPAADNVVKKLVDVSVATLLDRGLPATSLPGLPSTETGTGA